MPFGGGDLRLFLEAHEHDRTRVLVESLLGGRTVAVDHEHKVLRHWYFTGNPEVRLELAQWQVPVEEIRAIARQRGYEERPAPPWAVSFTFSPRPPVTPAPASPKAAARLESRLARTDFAWVSTAATGMSQDAVAAVAARHGMSVTRVFGDAPAPVLLVSRFPVPGLRVLVGGRTVDKLSRSTLDMIARLDGRDSVRVPMTLRIPDSLMSHVAHEMGYAYRDLIHAGRAGHFYRYDRGAQ